MKKLMLLVNPVAGKAGYKDGFGDVLETFSAGGYLPTVFMTTGPKDATDIIVKYSGDYDLAVCFGGDGTLSETVSGIIQLKNAPPLGYIPVGTANDVATTLGLPRSPVKAAEKILGGELVPLDVGTFGSDEHFTYIAAFGAFTQVSYETPQGIKNMLGYMAYIFTGLLKIPSIVPIRARIEYDGGVIEDDFVFGGVTNSMSIAGLIHLGKEVVELGDGLFEIILVHKPRDIWDANKTIMDILWQNYHTNNVTLLRSKSVRFNFDSAVPWTRDGESGGDHSDLLLTNIHGAVNFIL